MTTWRDGNGRAGLVAVGRLVTVRRVDAEPEFPVTVRSHGGRFDAGWAVGVIR